MSIDDRSIPLDLAGSAYLMVVPNSINDLEYKISVAPMRKRRVFVPRGTYEQTDTTKLTGILVPDDSWIEGADRRETIFKDSRGATADLVGFFTNFSYGTASRNHNITLKCFSIDGNRTVGLSQGFGIYMDNVDNVLIEDVYVYNTYHGGIEFCTLTTRGSYASPAKGLGNTYVTKITVINVEGYDCGTDTLAISSKNVGTISNDITVSILRSDGHAARSGGTGLTLSIVNDAHIFDIKSKNGVHATDGDGVRLYGVTHCQGNLLETNGNSRWGVMISIATGPVRATDINVCNIIAHGNGYSNVYINQGDDINLQNVSACNSVNNDGIEVIGGSVTVIVNGATLKNNALYGMRGAVTATSYLYSARIDGNGSGDSLNVTATDNIIT